MRENLKNWNDLIDDMYTQCIFVGPERCLPVYYEQIVLHLESEMKKIFKFLKFCYRFQACSSMYSHTLRYRHKLQEKLILCT